MGRQIDRGAHDRRELVQRPLDPGGTRTAVHATEIEFDRCVLGVPVSESGRGGGSGHHVADHHVAGTMSASQGCCVPSLGDGRRRRVDIDLRRVEAHDRESGVESSSLLTPACSCRVSSMRATQEPQCIPSTRNSTDAGAGPLDVSDWRSVFGAFTTHSVIGRTGRRGG